MTIDWRQYLPGGRRDGATGIRSVAWQVYEIENPSGKQTCRSMLTLYELSLLYDLARDEYSGEGQIIDGGPLLGVGTNALAKGLAANSLVKDKKKRIFSFDLFSRTDMGETVADIPDLTNSVLEASLTLNRDYLDLIYISPGDLLTHHWQGGPIEILFIDIAKSWSLNQFVLRNFFSQLIPGKSIVIQQDYVYFHGYWIHITMELLSDYFELIDLVFGASAVYRLTKPIPQRLLEKPLEQLSLQEKVSYIDRAIEKAPASAGEVLKCARAASWSTEISGKPRRPSRWLIHQFLIRILLVISL